MYIKIIKLLFFVCLLVIHNSVGATEGEWQNDPNFLKANAWLDLSGSEEDSEIIEDTSKKSLVESTPKTNLETDNGPSRYEKYKEVLEKAFKTARQLFRSDPLSVSRKSTDSHGRSSVFNPVRLRLIKFDGFTRTLGNTTSYAVDLGKERSVSLSLNYAPLKLKGDFGTFKMKSWDLGLGFRKYFRKKYLFQSNLGIRKYQPNWAYRDYYAAKNQRFGDETLPYLNFELGRQILKEVPLIKRPLVLTASYTFSDDLKYPSADPHGYHKIDLEGFNLKVSVNFKI